MCIITYATCRRTVWAACCPSVQYAQCSQALPWSNKSLPEGPAIRDSERRGGATEPTEPYSPLFEQGTARNASPLSPTVPFPTLSSLLSSVPASPVHCPPLRFSGGGRARCCSMMPVPPHFLSLSLSLALRRGTGQRNEKGSDRRGRTRKGPRAEQQQH